LLFLSLCGCGGSYGTTRLFASAIAFLVQAFFNRLTRCGVMFKIKLKNKKRKRVA